MEENVETSNFKRALNADDFKAHKEIIKKEYPNLDLECSQVVHVNTFLLSELLQRLKTIENKINNE